MNTLHHQSVRDLRGRLKWQEAKVSSLREKCSQLSESESPAEYGALCSRLEQERLLLGALQICVTLMDDGKEAESSDPRQRRRSLALVKEKSETNNNARRGRSYTAAGVAPQQELDEIEFFGAQQRAMMALDDCVRDLQQRTYGWTVTVPSQSNNSATDTDSQATDHYEGDSTTETEFAEDRVVSSSLEDTDTDTGMLRRDSTLEALDLSATQTSSTNNSNSSNDSNNQRKHRRVTSSMGMKSEKRGKRRSLKHTLSQFLSAGTQGGQGGGAGSDTPLGTHRKLHLSKDLSIGSAITLAELNKGTGESRKSEYLGENVLRERLNESNARDDLRKALTDIKRKILACEQRVKTLQNKLKKMPKENDDWRATKVELDEQKMLLTALQINVMVFKRYTNGEDAVEPSSRSSSGVSSSPRSLLDASLSPRGLHAHRTTGGGRKGTLLQGILPGLERERNPSIARSASSVQGFFASSIPSMRPRVTYDSDTSRSDVILQSGSFSSCCKVSMDSRELETGTLRDIITWTLMLSDRTMADNADLEALLLFCHSAFVPDDLLITLMEVWEHFEDTSFPEEFGAGGMRKRLVNFIGQVLRTVHISIPVDVRRAMLDMCESHIDTQDHKHLTGLVEREQEPLHHVRGVEDALERTTVEPDFDFLRHSPSALARELSVLMSDALFCLGQRLTEFIDMRWMQTPPVNAPLIARVTDMFNRLQRFVVHSILVVSSPKQQVAVIKHWLKTADECLSAHSDINSVATILAGLTDIAISRLKKYKSLLADRHVQTFQRLEKHISSKDNFREYRESLSSSSSLPFLAVHLRDLAYLEEANQTKILRRETTGALEVLSFERMRKFRSMILSMHLHTLGQDTPLPVPWNPSLLASLATIDAPPLDELFQMSLRLEPPPVHVLQKQLRDQGVRLSMLQEQLERARTDLMAYKRRETIAMHSESPVRDAVDDITRLTCEVDEYRQQLESVQGELQEEREKRTATELEADRLRSQNEALKKELSVFRLQKERRSAASPPLSFFSSGTTSPREGSTSPPPTKKESSFSRTISCPSPKVEGIIRSPGWARKSRIGATSTNNNGNGQADDMCLLKLNFQGTWKSFHFPKTESIRDMKISVTTKLSQTHPIQEIRQCKLFLADEMGNPKSELYSNLNIKDAFRDTKHKTTQGPLVCYFACLHPPFTVIE